MLMLWQKLLLKVTTRISKTNPTIDKEEVCVFSEWTLGQLAIEPDFHRNKQNHRIGNDINPLEIQKASMHYLMWILWWWHHRSIFLSE